MNRHGILNQSIMMVRVGFVAMNHFMGTRCAYYPRMEKYGSRFYSVNFSYGGATKFPLVFLNGRLGTGEPNKSKDFKLSAKCNNRRIAGKRHTKRTIIERCLL